MDSISRDFRTYGGIITAAQARAAGIDKLLEDKTVAKQFKERGIDASDSKHLNNAATTLAADLVHMRQLWAEIQSLSGHMHEESAALADDVRSVDDSARSALGRKSELLPTLGIKPAIRTVKSHKTKAAATASDTAGALSASHGKP